MEPNHPTSSNDYAADISSIRQAQVRIGPFAHKTPVLTSETLDSIAGRKLYFKCECLQKGGAFKFRGACNAIYSRDDDHAAKGVVTHSSGNHAATLALAAKLRASLLILLYQKILQNAKSRMSNVTVVRLSGVSHRCSPGRILQTRCCKILVLFLFIPIMMGAL